MRIGLVGFGEVGQAFAEGLSPATSEIKAVDPIAEEDSRRGEIARDTATRLSIELAGRASESLRSLELVFSAVVPSESLKAVHEVAPFLGENVTFVDLNSVSARTKQEAALVVGRQKGLFVDAAILGAVPSFGHRVPLLVAGSGAASFAEMVRPVGMDVRVLTAEVGKAATVKMCRSILIKGIDALVLESLSLAHAYGLDREVLDTLNEAMPGVNWESFTDLRLSRMAVHALRRSQEMVEVRSTLDEAGVRPLMTEAIRARLEELVPHPRPWEVPASSYMEVLERVQGGANHG